MTITRTSVGPRTAIVERPDHTVIVTRGAGHGYVQRPFVVHNQTYVQRTYYVNNVRYVHVYRPYVYRGVTLHVYAPVRYYPLGFYGWVYSPWRVPVYYRWGWIGSPWYGYYGGYFTPYPVYASPALWLTDYLIAATLEAAYRERMAEAAEARANAAYAGQVALTPDVKQAIADEVQRQLAQERAEAQNSQAAYGGVPPILSDNSSHVFVVSHSLDVPNLGAGGQACLLTEGDVLQSSGAPPRDADAASLVVIASKGPDCRKGSLVSVSFQDLMEMQNQMRETIDQGLEDLRAKQGQGGIPALPGDARSAPVPASYAAAAPPPESNVAGELRQQAQQASQAEQEVVSQASAPESATVTITLGQTPGQVTAVLGAPEKIVDLGAKKMYVYKDMKITFVDGKVSDVQ